MRLLTWKSPWVFTALLLLVAGCGKRGGTEPAPGPAPEAPRNAAPEAALEAAKAAAAKHDYQAFSRLLTPAAQQEMAGGLVLMSQLLQAMPASKEADKARAEQLRSRLREVFAKHGLDEKTIPKIHLQGNASPEEQAREMAKLAAPIKDHGGFVSDVLGALHTHGDKPDARLIEENARLKDVKVDGKTATATFVQSRNGKESAGPITFEKVGDEWKISKVPPLLS